MRPRRPNSSRSNTAKAGRSGKTPGRNAPPQRRCAKGSPLTPALSPLRGEGTRPAPSDGWRRLAALGAAPPREESAATRRRGSETRRASSASPSPNGERAGVRGEAVPRRGLSLSFVVASRASDSFQASAFGFRIWRFCPQSCQGPYSHRSKNGGPRPYGRSYAE
jgi:hypothetical protein